MYPVDRPAKQDAIDLIHNVKLSFFSIFIYKDMNLIIINFTGHRHGVSIL
jgi:hypothetical protein